MIQVKRFFHRVAGDVADFDSPFDAVSQLSELLKQDDSDWLALDIGTLVKKYPDVSQEQESIMIAKRLREYTQPIKKKFGYLRFITVTIWH